jgi:hypothetical protein
VRATWWRDEQDEVVDDRAGARWRPSQEVWREAGPSMRGLVVCPQNHRRTVFGLGLKTKSEGPTRRRRDPGVSGSFEAEDTRRDRMACVGRTQDAAKAWPSDGKTHKHYINAPAWVVSPVVELGVVESFSTLPGPDI